MIFYRYCFASGPPPLPQDGRKTHATPNVCDGANQGGVQDQEVVQVEDKTEVVVYDIEANNHEAAVPNPINIQTSSATDTCDAQEAENIKPERESSEKNTAISAPSNNNDLIATDDCKNTNDASPKNYIDDSSPKKKEKNPIIDSTAGISGVTSTVSSQAASTRSSIITIMSKDSLQHLGACTQISH